MKREIHSWRKATRIYTNNVRAFILRDYHYFCIKIGTIGVKQTHYRFRNKEMLDRSSIAYYIKKGGMLPFFWYSKNWDKHFPF